VNFRQKVWESQRLTELCMSEHPLCSALWHLPKNSHADGNVRRCSQLALGQSHAGSFLLGHQDEPIAFSCDCVYHLCLQFEDVPPLRRLR
jgi:hypothetical protein